MNSRLPHELQTRKVVSLPDDIRSIVEDLIIQKFDIPEVMEDSDSNAFFDPSRIQEAMNTLVVTIRSVSGQLYRLAQIIRLDLRELDNYHYETRPGYEHPIFVAWSKRVAQEIDKKVRDTGFSVGGIEAEMNGYRDRITDMESLARFMSVHYRKDDQIKSYAYDRRYL